MAQGWVVLLEASFREPDLELDQVEALLAMLADNYPSAIHAPDRCAVQFLVPGVGPDDALAAGIGMWRAATSELAFPKSDLVRVEVKTPEELESEYEHCEVSPPPRPADEHALALAYDATRSLLRATTRREAVSVLQALVRKLGGTVLTPRAADPRILDVDLSLGEGRPIAPAAEPYSVARLCLEEVVPAAVEDAQRLVGLLRAADAAAAAAAVAAPGDAAYVDSDLTYGAGKRTP